MQKTSFKSASGLALLTAVCCAASARAEVSLRANAALGTGYDSNVSVEEIERPSGEGDRFRSSDLQFDVSDTIHGITGTLTYAYSRNSYEEFDNVNRETQTWGASLEGKLGNTRLGASYFAADADLADNPFLTYRRFSPHISGFISRRWFLRGAIVDAQKDITDRPGRAADNMAMEIDGYYFWRGLRRYFNVGYSYEQEDSRANRYDYRAHLLKLRMIQRFSMNGSLGTFEIGGRFETRDYTDITPQIQAERDDSRIRLRAELTLPLQQHLHWRIYARYGNYDSNLASVDYEEAVIGTQLELRF